MRRRENWVNDECFEQLWNLYYDIIEKCDMLNFGGNTYWICNEITYALEDLREKLAKYNYELDEKINPNIEITENEQYVMSFVRDILELEEFDLETEGTLFKLNDCQGWNLWDIEWDRFDNLAEVLDRMDIYHNDYIYEPLEEREECWEEIKENDWDLTVKKFLSSNNIANILKWITTRKRNKMDYILDWKVKKIITLL